MPKRRKIILLIAVAALVVTGLYLCRDTTSADAQYRAWSNAQRWSWRLRDAERQWPASIVRLLHISQWQRDYAKRAGAQKADLLRSGYLVEFRVNIITNGVKEMTAISDQLDKAFPPRARDITLELRWDRITVLCRSNDAAICLRNLNLTTFSARPIDNIPVDRLLR